MFKLGIIKKADIVLVAVLIVCGIAASVFLSLGTDKATSVVITSDGKVYGTYDLLEDQDISINKNGLHNKIVIKKGQVYMSSADCHNHDCIKQSKISQASQTIICLPHKLVVEIKGESKKYDSISK